MAARRATGVCSGDVVPRTIVVGKRRGGLTLGFAVAGPAGTGLCDIFQA